MKSSSGTRLAVASLLFLGFAVVFRSLALSIDIPINHVDGTFQTASGLVRLKNGLCPGPNFLPYLGIGLLYLLFPFFELAGGSVSASMFAAQALTYVSFFVAIFCVSRLAFRGHSGYSAFIAGLFLVIGMLIPQYLPDFLFDRLRPGQSLRPIRALAPYCIFLVAPLLLKLWGDTRKTAIAIGAIGALSLLWSNDYGLPSFLSLTGFMVSMRLLSRLNRKNLLTFGISLVVCAALALILSTCGNPQAIAAYNFVDVAKDQWWYFGPWSDASRIYSLADLYKLHESSPNYSLAIVMGLLVCLAAIASKSVEIFALAWLTIAIILGSLVTSTGGHIEPGYLNPPIFHAFLVGSMLPIGYLLRYKASQGKSTLAPAISTINWALFATFSVSLATMEFVRYREDNVIAASDPSRIYVAELGGYLPANWRWYVDEARSSQSSAAEEYWGIFSAIQGRNGIFPVDSLIHALGATREEAKRRLVSNHPETLITTRMGYSGWQAWSLSSNWWFYREAILNYTPTHSSFTSVIWKRKNWPTATHPIDCPVKDGHAEFFAPEAGLYEISVTLESNAPVGRHLLFTRNRIVHAMRSEGYLSLPTSGLEKVFPMLAMEPGIQPIELRYQGNVKAATPKVARCSVTYYDFEHPDVLPRPTLHSTVSVNNRFWENGVSLSGPILLFMDTPQNRMRYQADKTLLFIDGSKRQISRVEQVAPYLEVYYSGWRLPTSTIGSPAKVAIR